MQRLPSPRVRARDAGLALAARLRRWLIGGSIALTALLSIIAGRSFAGRTARASAASASAGATASASSPASAPASSPNDGSALQPPAQAPVPAPGLPAPVVSGGS